MILEIPNLPKQSVELFTANRIRPSFVMYVNNMTRTTTGGRCIEIGTSTGVNAETMLSNSDINLVVVDPYTDNRHEEAIMRDRLSVYGSRVEIFIEPSVEAAKRFPDNYFDYVYLDGDHTYEGVIADLEAWYPKVKDHGLLAGHDVVMDSVQQAVFEFAQNIDRRVFCVMSFSKHPDSPVPWNLGQCFDWWIWVDRT